MTARALGSAVLIEGDSLSTLRYAVAMAVREKRRNGLRPGPLLDALDRAAALAVGVVVAAERQDDTPDPGDESPCDQWLTTATVAEQLGCSLRSAQRLARRLDGRQVGGVWHIDPQALTEHQAATRKDEP